jgi:putative sterol carrier protein
MGRMTSFPQGDGDLDARMVRALTRSTNPVGRRAGTAGATDEFFAELTRRGHEPLLEKYTGAVRFDLTDGGRTERWLVTVDRGDVRVSHDDAPAGCVVYAERAVFDGIAGGRVNPMAAMLRGALLLEGSPELLVLVQRLFPGPAGRPVAAGGRR